MVGPAFLWKQEDAWPLCFKQFLQVKVRMHNLKRAVGARPDEEEAEFVTGYLTTNEIQKAEEEIIRYVQRYSFPNEFEALTNMADDASE